MNDDLGYELRASWRSFDPPDSETTSRNYEKQQVRQAANDKTLIEQAQRVVMSSFECDRETAGQLLQHLAKKSRLRFVDLARAITQVATATGGPAHARAVDIAGNLLNRSVLRQAQGVARANDDSIDLRNPAPNPRTSHTG